MDDDLQGEIVTKTVAQIRPLMVGLPPGVQGAIIADLLAIWLAGHRGDEDVIEQYREVLLGQHNDLVRALIPINVASMARSDRDPMTAVFEE